MLADTLRTDRARLHPLLPDTAARLLGEVGDRRAGCRTPQPLARPAGIAPFARQSGMVKCFGFRWAADKQPRDADTDFAGDSRHTSSCVADLDNLARAPRHGQLHAVRILARARLYSIWHRRQDGVAYDPANLRALQTPLNHQQHTAA